MGLADKVIKRLEQQADTIAQYRQLDDRRRSRIAELERKLGDAEREQHKLAAEVEMRRKELDTLTHLSQAEFENVRKDRDHWKQARQDAHEAGELLLKCTQTLQAEIDTLRQQLADAQREASDEFTERQVLTAEQQEGEATWRQQLDAAQAELERLRAFAGKARKAISPAMNYWDVEVLFSALVELDAGTAEPTPVAEPLDAESGA